MLSKNVKAIIELQSIYGDILSQKKIKSVDVKVCVLINKITGVINLIEMMDSSKSISHIRLFGILIKPRIQGIIEEMKESAKALKKHSKSSKNFGLVLKLWNNFLVDEDILSKKRK